MTSSTKSVSRVSEIEHTRHKRKIIAVIGPGDVVGFRLQNSKQDSTAFLSFECLFNIAERKRAETLAGFDSGPCADPKKKRNL